MSPLPMDDFEAPIRELKKKVQREKGIYENRRAKWKEILEQFPKLKPETQGYWVKKALSHSDIPEAIEIVKLGKPTVNHTTT